MTAIYYTQKQQEANARILGRISKQVRRYSKLKFKPSERSRDCKGRFLKEQMKSPAELRQEVFDELIKDQEDGISNPYIKACYMEIER